MTWFSAPLSVVRHRHLIWMMVRRDVQGRYRGSALGALWALASPLFLIAIYAIFFGVFLQLRPAGRPGVADFGLFIMAGVVPWMAFSEGLTRSTSVVLDNRTLVKKVVFPLEVLPANVVIAALVGQAIGLVVLSLALLLMRGQSPLGLLLVPLLLVPQVLFTLGLAWLLASIGVFLRDLAQAIGLLMTAWMFLTPIFYSPSALPADWRWLLVLNPMAQFVVGYRAALMGEGGLDLLALGAAVVIGLLTFLVGGAWFMRTKHAFADVV